VQSHNNWLWLWLCYILLTKFSNIIYELVNPIKDYYLLPFAENSSLLNVIGIPFTMIIMFWTSYSLYGKVITSLEFLLLFGLLVIIR